MACLNPDGTLTDVARRVLGVLEVSAAGELAVVAGAGLPLWRVRASLRALAAAGLIASAGDNHMVTDKGREVLDLARELDGE